MGDRNTLLYDSTPEKLGRKRQIGDRNVEKVKTTAWNESETELPEIRKYSNPSVSEVSETVFIGDVSPVHSSPGRSDKELLKIHRPTPIRAMVRSGISSYPTPEKKRDEARKDAGSEKHSEISSLRSVTPHSDSRSYRERIKERVAAAKERALASSQKGPVLHRGKSPSAKSDNLDKEDEEVEEAMRKHRAMRTRWKSAMTSAQVANIQSGYDMFSKSWEEPTTPPKSRAISEEKSGKGDESEDEKLLCHEVLGSREDDWLPLFNYEPPSQTDFQQLKQKQIGIFFCPSTSPVPIEEKLEPNMTPRFLEDEGLYVGKSVKIPWKRLNKIEQRIMAMGSERLWFGEDGELKGTPDPLDHRRFRHNLEDIVDPSLVIYKPAVVEKKDSVGLDISSETPHILEIDLGKIEFEHHPLFSEEETLSAKLKYMINALDNISSDRLGRRLQALRNSNKAGGEGDKRKMKKELREIRTRWLNEKKCERELTQMILETWRDLKSMRTTQGYQVTNIRLIIVMRDQLPHENEWDQQVEMFVQEMEEEAEEEYSSEMESYNRKIEQWKAQCEEEETTGDESGSTRPEKPKKISRQKIRKRVVSELALSLRPPDEPILELSLVFDDNVPVTVSNKQEQERRNAVGKSQLWVVLRHNDKEVDRVKALQEPNFVYQIAYRFGLKLTQWPKSLGLRLIDEGLSPLFGKKPIAEIYIPIPGRISTEVADWQNFEFSCGHITGELSHSGVGTSVKKLTSGTISVRMGWAEPLPNILPPSKSHKDVSKGKNSDVEKLKEWVEQVQLDPNDPTNADLLEYIKSKEERIDFERQQRDSSCLDLCTDEDISENPRLKLLTLRQAGQPEFRSMRKVPLNDREIPKDIFKMYQKRIGLVKKKGKCGLDDVREEGKIFLDQLREEVTKVWRQEHNKTFREMVHEEPVPDLWTLGLTFMKWLQPKRPLRPKRKGRKKLPVKSLVGQQLEIMVNIGRAFEVPVRKEEDKTSEDFQVVAVRPFVEVTFQDQRRRTPTGEGPNPTWNQDLHIPVHCPAGIQSVQDSLHFHLYDETLVDLVEDDRLRETNIHQRMGRYWLGSFRIPFSYLYQSSRIEGTFQLYSPPVLLGYTRESKEFRDSTFLSIFVMVHPPLHPPAPFLEKLETKEETSLEVHLEQWLLELSKSFPNRRVVTLVTDTSSKSVCITRYLRPIKPPEIIENEVTTVDMAARFVSMIPVSHSHQHVVAGMTDIWMTADEILEHCVTPPYSQATLLACYLLSIDSDLEVRLLFGTGVPGGSSVYIMTLSRTTKEIKIWDPSTGKKYTHSDPFCPLSRVHAIVDHTNIWVNSQKEELISQINLDVNKRYDWWPAFGRSISAPKESVQPESLVYLKTSQMEVQRLQDKLEKLLRNAIMKLRHMNRTIWNRYVQSSLRKLLPELEKSMWTGNIGSPPDHIQELQHITSSYKMCGFPINMSYTTPTALVEAVKSTGVHMNDAPDIEFSMAVYIHPFPSNVLSIWVYVASLIRRQ
ncbi:coiled-coil and C2 domain-containing protein 2A [Cimex lectularius]|uniref:C2 domain-containing protein n=1 Tax=Cimex lectularius TaxID=79782 RepID=A0A8I6RR43_CIMLE|nr:coiled-coil and C2 domain-containing protein 2A [Cimex lectularius]